MRAVKRPTDPVKRKPTGGGGSVSQMSLSQRRKIEAQQKKKIKDMEAQIASVKGTPAAKALVEEHRRLTGQK